MIAIISSIIISISVLVTTLITFTPNARVITESDFMRNGVNNAYLYSWELAQLDVRTGNLTLGNSTGDVPLGYLSEKNNTPNQSLKANISYAVSGDLNIIVSKE